MKTKNFFYWIARLAATLIMAQTLYFKFTGASESVEIFKAVGMEPWGRIGVGVAELIASILLLITPVAWLGALLAIGLMLGAIGMHLTLLGIEVQNDGGYLFGLAVAVLVCAVYVVYHDLEKIKEILRKLITSKS